MMDFATKKKRRTIFTVNNRKVKKNNVMVIEETCMPISKLIEI
jgi:hypothetical protein